MKYRVVFMQRTDGVGNPTEAPPDFVALDMPDGVVQDAVFVSRNAPLNLHAQEAMTEDDEFLSVGTEVWEYDVAEGRERDFIDALKNSRLVIEIEEADDEMIGELHKPNR